MTTTKWNKEKMMADLAKPFCKICKGVGYANEQYGPCSCVLRRIFTTCLGEYLRINAGDKFTSRVSLRRGIDPCRPNEEYSADFVLVSRRALKGRDFDLLIFKHHICEGRDFGWCASHLKAERGTFFHRAYHLQEILGRAFFELEPYALYPLASYYSRDKNLVSAMLVDEDLPVVQHHVVVPIRLAVHPIETVEEILINGDRIDDRAA